MFSEMDKVMKCIDEIVYVPDKFEDETLDEETYNWYLQRFLMLEEDGCAIAINEYLVKLVREHKVNDYTTLAIQRAAFTIMTRS